MPRRTPVVLTPHHDLAGPTSRRAADLAGTSKGRGGPLLARLGLVVALAFGGAASCGGGSAGAPAAASGGPAPAASASSAESEAPSPGAPSATTAPPPFTASTTAVTAADLASTWRAGCPVGPADLRLVSLSHWGFDGEPHTGTIVVNATAVDAVVAVFSRLYEARFPIRQVQPVDAYGGSDDASTAADNTAGFNCRDAVATGPPRWSQHAYGLAIDVNPLENPAMVGGQVLPPAGAAYLDRADVRAGMAVDGGPLVDAFAAAGWGWGGRWQDVDYQHFSASGR